MAPPGFWPTMWNEFLPIGFGGPKRGFEAPLGGPPQGIRCTELGPSQAGQTDQPVAPVLWIDSDRDQLFTGERLQGVSKTAGVHYQRVGQCADRRRLGSPDFSQYRALRRLQAARRERRIVKLRDSSRRLSQFRAMAAPFAFRSCVPGSLFHVMISALICKHMLASSPNTSICWYQLHVIAPVLIYKHMLVNTSICWYQLKEHPKCSS